MPDIALLRPGARLLWGPGGLLGMGNSFPAWDAIAGVADGMQGAVLSALEVGAQLGCVFKVEDARLGYLREISRPALRGVLQFRENNPMYAKPTVVKFGNFRDLTRLWGAGVNDAITGDDGDGCYSTRYQIGSYTCWQGASSS